MSATRILLLTTELVPAGAERIVYELATRLPRPEWEVEVASLRSPGGDDGAVAADLARAGIPVTSLRFHHKRDLRGAARLAWLLRRHRPALVHGHLFHGNLAARLVAPVCRARVITTHHVVERRPLRWRPRLERWTSWRDAATVCVSEAVARHAASTPGARPDRLRVIPNGIDLARFHPPEDAATAKTEARRRLGLPLDRPVVGAVGRLDPQKGCDTLLQAFAELTDVSPAPLLVLIGEGPQRRELEGLAGTLGVADRVHLVGRRDDVPELLPALDVFAMPSRWEGFGLALAEALAAGLPVVASAVDSLPEVLAGAGRLVPHDDPRSLASALHALLTDPAERAHLSALGPPRAAHYDVDRMVAAYAALYREVLAAS